MKVYLLYETKSGSISGKNVLGIYRKYEQAKKTLESYQKIMVSYTYEIEPYVLD